MNMESPSLQLCDLPDEILLLIFKQLHNVPLFYSLFNVNKRLNPILCDPNLTNYLNFVQFCCDDHTYRLSDPMLDRFCSEILPSIHHHIKQLDLEPSSIERVLRSTNYPNLCALGLYDLKINNGKHLFTDETPLTNRLRNQIVSLVIDISKQNVKSSTEDLVHFIFLQIFSMFTNLKYLHIAPSSKDCQLLSFGVSPPSIFSSNLCELHINLKEFTDCLYLLDGRFSQLRILHANILEIIESPLLIENRKPIPSLRCFALCCDMVLDTYDEMIVPLLHRMSNLEELSLKLDVTKEKTFIDGNTLKSVINDMTALKKFTFNIRSRIDVENGMTFVSNEDIENSFSNFQFNQVVCCVDYFAKSNFGQCRIYSCPYGWEEYDRITNSFPGGLFPYVQKISLFDKRPFEHEFFLLIAQSFPLVKVLKVANKTPQLKNKERGKSKDEDQHLPIIEYPHLRDLYLEFVHEDYLEQFLLATKTFLPNGVNLFVHHHLLLQVTHYFRRNVTRFNCSKMNYHINGVGISEDVKHFKDYFLGTVLLRSSFLDMFAPRDTSL